MNQTAFLENSCQSLGLEVKQKSLGQLSHYYRELEKWGRKINLVAMDETKNLLEKHFVDSLLLLSVLDKEKDLNLLDVGTGAGFPGLVLKIARPELELTMVEPREKRVSFLRHIVRTLKLEQVTIINKRLEEIPGHSGWPMITSRALSDIKAFLEMAAPFTREKGKVICMKGPRAADEIKLWQEEPDSPFKFLAMNKFLLPRSGAARNIVIFEKK